MDSKSKGSRARVAKSAPSGFPSLGLLLLYLLANLSSREEVYANLEYGFSVLALLGAAGCIGRLAASISRRPGVPAFACCVSIRVPAAAVPCGVPGRTGEWPVLVGLLFGLLVFLLSGLGGWV